jgi:hypothetical protein
VPLAGAKPSLGGGLQRAILHSAGVEYRLPAGFSTSVVLYQNVFFRLTDLFGLAELNDASPDEDDESRATGRSVGAELLLRRDLSHRLGGFVSYTLSRTQRSAGRLEGPAATDRTHVLQTAASYALAKHWRFGSRVMLYSGQPGHVATIEQARRPPRAPPFWRWDWRLEKRWPDRRGRGDWGLVFEVLNTTANREITSYDCTERPCTAERFGPVTVPSIGVDAVF